MSVFVSRSSVCVSVCVREFERGLKVCDVLCKNVLMCVCLNTLVCFCVSIINVFIYLCLFTGQIYELREDIPNPYYQPPSARKQTDQQTKDSTESQMDTTPQETSEDKTDKTAKAAQNNGQAASS